mmetsp:Transcript_1586/g.4698  ORF Transcript_1586/g.4698 Transcript_1586/m.4698 type:complete len:226 (-) Transcript_1586:763-1440(-)
MDASMCTSLLSAVPVAVLSMVGLVAVTQGKQSGPAVFPPEHQHHFSSLGLRHIPFEDAAPFMLFALLLALECLLRVGVHRQVQVLQRQREAALEEARQLRAEATPLETPATYSQAAKLQRRALMREKHAEMLERQQAYHATEGVAKSLRTAKAAAVAAFVVYSWGRPAAVLGNPTLLWPLEHAFKFVPGKLSGSTGVVSAPAWGWVCLAASSRIASLVAPDDVYG